MGEVPSGDFAPQETQLAFEPEVRQGATPFRRDKLYIAVRHSLQQVLHETADNLVGTACVATAACNIKRRIYKIEIR